jgi:hypothetical protein
MNISTPILGVGKWRNGLRTGDDGELETRGRIRLIFNYKEEEIQTIVPLTIFGEGLRHSEMKCSLPRFLAI